MMFEEHPSIHVVKWKQKLRSDQMSLITRRLHLKTTSFLDNWVQYRPAAEVKNKL